MYGVELLLFNVYCDCCSYVFIYFGDTVERFYSINTFPVQRVYYITQTGFGVMFYHLSKRHAYVATG
jgi:hypothetical protein